MLGTILVVRGKIDLGRHHTWTGYYLQGGSRIRHGIHGWLTERIRYMPTVARNVLAALAGVVVGSLVNMGLVNIGPSVVPLPEGADVSTPEGMRASMALFTPVNFVFPFLAHALGTLAGAFVAARLAASHGARIALGIGVFFLLGGIAAVIMLGGPLWFIVADLLLAYVPMGYLGAVLAGATRRHAAPNT